VWAKDGSAEGAGKQIMRDGIDLVEGDAVDLFQRMRDAAVFAVVQLTAADAVHPRAGVLQPENEPAAQ
jgi:hypothetical protein